MDQFDYRWLTFWQKVNCLVVYLKAQSGRAAASVALLSGEHLHNGLLAWWNQARITASQPASQPVDSYCRQLDGEVEFLK